MSAAAVLDAPSLKAWPQAKLADVADIVNGGTPKSNVAEFWDGEHQWLTPADMGKMAGREIAQTSRTITAMGLAKSSARLAPPKSVILSTRAPIGHLAINAVPMAFNQGCRAIVPGPKLDHAFLYYFLLHSRELLNDLGTGTTFKELSATSLKTVQIPLPPLEEQKRIVAALDQAFAALDRARALAEANLADARDLSGVVRDQIILGACADAPEHELAEFLTKATYGFTNPMPDADSGPWKITAKNVVDGEIDYESARHTTLEAFENDLTDKSRPKIGDVLITKDGTLGRTAVVDRDDICINQSVAVLATDARLNPSFLSKLLSTSPIQRSLIERAGGTTVKHLYITRIPETVLQIPDVVTQEAALLRLEQASERIARIIATARSKLADLRELRQSLLRKAFAGELT